MADKKAWLSAVRSATANLDDEKKSNFRNIMKELFDAIYRNR